MMQKKKADLWIDSQNNEITPEFTSSKSETAQKWRPSIVYLKEKSIECSEFDPNSRPSFEDLNEDLERTYETNYPKIHTSNSVSGEDDTYEGMI